MRLAVSLVELDTTLGEVLDTCFAVFILLLVLGVYGGLGAAVLFLLQAVLLP